MQFILCGVRIFYTRCSCALCMAATVRASANVTKIPYIILLYSNLVNRYIIWLFLLNIISEFQWHAGGWVVAIVFEFCNLSHSACNAFQYATTVTGWNKREICGFQIDVIWLIHLCGFFYSADKCSLFLLLFPSLELTKNYLYEMHGYGMQTHVHWKRPFKFKEL